MRGESIIDCVDEQIPGDKVIIKCKTGYKPVNDVHDTERVLLKRHSMTLRNQSLLIMMWLLENMYAILAYAKVHNSLNNVTFSFKIMLVINSIIMPNTHTLFFPICIELNPITVEQKSLPSNDAQGIVAGFGYTENKGSPAYHLQQSYLPLTSLGQQHKFP